MNNPSTRLCEPCMKDDGTAANGKRLFNETHCCEEHYLEFRKEDIILHLRKPDHTLFKKFAEYLNDYGGKAVTELMDQYESRYRNEILLGLYDKHKVTRAI